MMLWIGSPRRYARMAPPPRTDAGVGLADRGISSLSKTFSHL